MLFHHYTVDACILCERLHLLCLCWQDIIDFPSFIFITLASLYCVWVREWTTFNFYGMCSNCTTFPPKKFRFSFIFSLRVLTCVCFYTNTNSHSHSARFRFSLKRWNTTKQRTHQMNRNAIYPKIEQNKCRMTSGAFVSQSIASKWNRAIGTSIDGTHWKNTHTQFFAFLWVYFSIQVRDNDTQMSKCHAGDLMLLALFFRHWSFRFFLSVSLGKTIKTKQFQ